MAARVPLWERPTYVYKAFEAAGVLLYVGISDSWRTRVEGGHRKTSRWYAAAHHLEVDLYADRHQAFAVESWTIEQFQPVGNLEQQSAYVPSRVPTPLVSFGRLIYRSTGF